ncbi:MAG TPA: polyprenyl diphosphate synthase [Spirochaetota bacterium]|nr:polyprenyl diphosphate synthase [Spirochaetota bacterium]HPJ39421.1 polyprenyl diphosphate synthase [Spirochaetota bacterium]HPQ52797.1 polyprenyl diphosphate synthase [Spirochaetota bacterium]
MKNYKDTIDPETVPRHVAIIMDGNGRWAEKKKLPRLEGHRKGADIIEPLIDASVSLGIGVVSLFAFSTENWNRPASEVNGLWNLLALFFESKIDIIQEKGVKVVVSGARKRLPAETGRIIDSVIAQTKKNRNIVLNFCINYGGRQEILDGVNSWIHKRKDGELLTEKKLQKQFYVPELPDVDLLIRTSGEYRISNFMLWQLAYAELVFFDVLWPDFTSQHLYRAICEYQKRDRRYGAI